MIDLATLNQMKNIDIRTIDPDTVVNSNSINIDINLPVPERMKEYARQSVNPYFIKVGKVIVKMSHSNTSISANDCFERYMKTC